MRAGWCIALLLLSAFSDSRVIAQEPAEPKLPTPIIAQLLAEPELFAQRLVVVYGLVVEATETGTEFMLQDVSQRPLKVIGNNALKAVAGAELTVIGTFHPDEGEPYLVAITIMPTRVLGGGGCC
jgi:hypothetical protein